MDIGLGSKIEVDLRAYDYKFRNNIEITDLMTHLYLKDEVLVDPSSLKQGWDGQPYCNPDAKWYEKKIRHVFKVYGSSIYYQDGRGFRFWHYECKCGAWFERPGIIALKGSDALHIAPGTDIYIR